MKRTSEQPEEQTRTIAATETNARQETFFNIADNVRHQLGGITGMLFASGLGPVGSNRYDQGQIADMFQHASRGDTEIFARQFLSMDFLGEGGSNHCFTRPRSVAATRAITVAATNDWCALPEAAMSTE